MKKIALILLFICVPGCVRTVYIYTTKVIDHKKDVLDNSVARNIRNIVFIYARDAKGNFLGSGTGFIADKNEGYVLTAYHVVKDLGKTYLFVKFKEDGKWITKRPRWIMSLKDSDMSLIYVKHNFKSQVKMRFGELVTGETLFTIGYPDVSPRESGDPQHRTAFGEFYLPKYSFEPALGVSSNMQLSTFHIARGASGSPILDASGNAVGVLVWNAALDGMSTFTWSVPIAKYKFILSQRDDILNKIFPKTKKSR